MSETRKVVINACYGGFSLSPAAIRRLAEMEGRECYFFKNDISNGRLGEYVPISEEEATGTMFWTAYDIPDPSALPSTENWRDMSPEERQAANKAWETHGLGIREIARDDPRLIQIIEELGSGHGEGASGSCANLQIVEIPADVEWQVEEYDGNEWVSEKHRRWS